MWSLSEFSGQVILKYTGMALSRVVEVEDDPEELCADIAVVVPVLINVGRNLMSSSRSGITIFMVCVAASKDHVYAVVGGALSTENSPWKAIV